MGRSRGRMERDMGVGKMRGGEEGMGEVRKRVDVAIETNLHFV